MDENEISKHVIGAAIEVHKHPGPGLLESVYQQCMVRELRLKAINVNTELLLTGEYKGLNFDIDYRMDMLVADKVVVELKVVESILPVTGTPGAALIIYEAEWHKAGAVN